MKTLNSHHIAALLNRVGLETSLKMLFDAIKTDYQRFNDFSLSPRQASHFTNGVIELMPTATADHYSFKYVNGHPINATQSQLSIIAFGALCDTHSGKPLLLADMTLLTALRTACTSALAASYLANPDASTLGLIGCGAQSEFQAVAMHTLNGIHTIRYFDIDTHAMEKFADNLNKYNLNLIPCDSIATACQNAAIVTTATAAKKRANLLHANHIQPGTFINAIGGDCPGKTELDPALIQQAKVVIEYQPQTAIEGEIQNADHINTTELYRIVQGETNPRTNQDDIIIFDSVGIAIEDFSALRFLNTLCDTHEEIGFGSLLPQPQDPKNLFAELDN